MLARVIRWLLVGMVVAGVVAAIVRLNEAKPPDGPVPIVWDREVCAFCKMHIGDPRFAAQLQTSEGEVVSFDDPGCLFEYMQSHHVPVHALYFRDYDGSGWLSGDEAGFLPVDDSPMGYGIRAVSKSTPGAKDIAWAKSRAEGRRAEANGGS
ncbi:MAG: hypothetical protein WAU39_19640 [Polyangiales bacterium]